MYTDDNKAAAHANTVQLQKLSWQLAKIQNEVLQIKLY